MTLDDLLSPSSGALLLATTAGVHVLKSVVAPATARASWFRRSLPIASGLIGAILAASPFVWPDSDLPTRLAGGMIVGLLGPAAQGIFKRRKPPRVV